MNHLIYIADPMCSWCYGFGPELLSLLEEQPDTRLDIVVGGLRAYQTELMDQAMRDTLWGYWQQVAKASGQAFTEQALAHPDFTYDTEPACRALVSMRQLQPEAGAVPQLRCMMALQAAFYAEGKNITQGPVLAEVMSNAMQAQGMPCSAAEFLAVWESAAAKQETREHFDQTKRWQVGGFPTLVLAKPQSLELLSTGYAKLPQLQERLQALQAR